MHSLDVCYCHTLLTVQSTEASFPARTHDASQICTLDPTRRHPLPTKKHSLVAPDWTNPWLSLLHIMYSLLSRKYLWISDCLTFHIWLPSFLVKILYFWISCAFLCIPVPSGHTRRAKHTELYKWRCCTMIFYYKIQMEIQLQREVRNPSYFLASALPANCCVK